MIKLLTAGGHYIAGLAGIGAAAGLMASGHLNPTAGATIISGLSFGLAGIGGMHNAVNKSSGTG